MSYFVPISTTLRDAFLSESDLRYMQVVVDPAGTPVTFQATGLSCNASSDYESWKLECKNRDSLSVGLYANDDAIVQISDDGATWVTVFTGFVSDSGLGRVRGTVTNDRITMSLVNATQRKGTKRTPEPALLSQFSIVDTTTTSASVLHYLCSLMNVTPETSDISDTLPVANIGSNTVWSELQSLQEAYHADMYFRYDGKLLFRSPLEDSYTAPTSEWTFQGDPANTVSGASSWIKKTFSEEFLAVQCNYAKAQIDELELLDSQVLYKNTEGYDETTGAIEITLAAGEYWPGDESTDVAELYYTDPDTGEEFPYGIDIVTPTTGAYGGGYDIEYTGGTLTITSFNGSTAATSQGGDHSEIILQNSGTASMTIRKLQVRGKPYRLTSDTTVEAVDSSVTDAVDYVEQEIDGTYMVSQSRAFDCLYLVKEEGRIRPRQFSFSSAFMPWIQRNAIVSVQPPGESAVRCRIDSYQHRNQGNRTLQTMYTSIVCTELDTYTPTGTPTVKTNPQQTAIQAKLLSISDNASATYRSASTSAPTNPQYGDWWYQTDTQLYKRYDGSDWLNVGASPLETSSTSGVDFENSTGNVQILSDGTIKAVDGVFTGELTGVGSFGSFITGKVSPLSTYTYPITVTSGKTASQIATDLNTKLGVTQFTGSIEYNGSLYYGLIYDLISRSGAKIYKLIDQNGEGSEIASDDGTSLAYDITVNFAANPSLFLEDLIPLYEGQDVNIGSSTKPVRRVYANSLYDGGNSVLAPSLVNSGVDSVSANSKKVVYIGSTSDSALLVACVFNEDTNDDRWGAKTGYDDSGTTRSFWIRNTHGTALNYAWFLIDDL